MEPIISSAANTWKQKLADLNWVDAECKESKQCAPAKHHYDECVERVTGQQESGGAKEDCVEECKLGKIATQCNRATADDGLLTGWLVFHLAHCATQCAAPKLWSKLK